MRMYIVNAVFAILFSVAGIILFMYRTLYMACQGLKWNNPPTQFSWSWTYGLFGLTFLLTLVLTPACDNGCERVDSLTGVGWLIALMFIFIPLAYIQLYYCNLNTGFEDKNKPKPLFDPDTGEDLRPPLSGYDFVFVGVGLGIILGDIMLGACPSSCAIKA